MAPLPAGQPGGRNPRVIHLRAPAPALCHLWDITGVPAAASSLGTKLFQIASPACGICLNCPVNLWLMFPAIGPDGSCQSCAQYPWPNMLEVDNDL